LAPPTANSDISPKVQARVNSEPAPSSFMLRPRGA
jgi:hypothetical protein